MLWERIDKWALDPFVGMTKVGGNTSSTTWSILSFYSTLFCWQCNSWKDQLSSNWLQFSFFWILKLALEETAYICSCSREADFFFGIHAFFLVLLFHEVIKNISDLFELMLNLINVLFCKRCPMDQIVQLSSFILSCSSRVAII